METNREVEPCKVKVTETDVTQKAEKVEDTLSVKNGTEDKEQGQITKVYKRRWVMLIIFALVCMSNTFQWIQFSIITSIIMKYYGVSSATVNLTSIIFMLAYIPCIFPGAWLMEKLGLRWTLLLGAFGTAAGAWIKVLGVPPDLFYVIFIGIVFVAVSQVFILGVPPKVAAVWFGPKEVAFACSFGVSGCQFGVALGFLLPPIWVKDSENLNEIGDDLRRMYYIVAGVCTALFLVVLFVFQDKPPLPPTLSAQASISQSQESQGYLKSVKRICTNPNYILLFLAYGIIIGVFNAMSTLLNQTVLIHFPGQEENAGRIGLTIVVTGIFGSIVCGLILDRTHKFKETTIVVYVLGLVSMLAYTFTFTVEYIWVTFITAGAVGFFVTGYFPVGFEFAAELTYPEPEFTSAGLLTASNEIFGIIFTIVGGSLLDKYGDLACNGTLSAALAVGLLLTFFIKSDLRRQKANQPVNLNNGLKSSANMETG